ncbi:MAG: type II toxin-antitoxin system PemK/MazF family toxin [Acidobacteria bacterium]|nr:type II toxin-antitoxin system PemK/MazF family toxin [Acidobacteriota bacterium]
MGKFIKGDVVIIPFPFSDLTSVKKRPALVVATMLGDDIILAQITSKAVSDSYSIEVSSSDFSTGSLNQDSLVRPNRIFTADSNIVSYKAGFLKPYKLQEVINKIIDILSA